MWGLIFMSWLKYIILGRNITRLYNYTATSKDDEDAPQRQNGLEFPVTYCSRLCHVPLARILPGLGPWGVHKRKGAMSCFDCIFCEWVLWPFGVVWLCLHQGMVNVLEYFKHFCKVYMCLSNLCFAPEV